MSTQTKIEWTERTWNPAVGCSKVSPGCANCYAEAMAIERLMVVETKGDHLEGNNDTNYKKRLLELCSGSFQWENVTRVGELELVYNPQTTVNCALVYQKDWKSELGGLLIGKQSEPITDNARPCTN